MADQVSYLNRDPAAMLGSLVSALDALPPKLVKQPPAQWVSTIKSLTQKGVKQAEIDDCELTKWLDMQAATGVRSIDRTTLIDHVKVRQTTVKEVVLGRPQYASYSHLNHVQAAGVADARYSEVLFIANSEKANIEDALEEIDWNLEQYNFDTELLSTNPEGVLVLEKQRAELMSNVGKAWDYNAPHFTSGVEGKHAKNLIAHGRELVFGDTYLIEEVQSDWGQRGRQDDWKTIPRGPFVTDTKLWAGLVTRRLLQRAALNPKVKKVCWIRGSMRNGGLQVTEDKLDEFYVKTVRSIVDKAIGKAGGKVEFKTLKLGPTLLADVPTFEMTDAVRADLTKVQPLYSRTRLLPASRRLDDEERSTFLHRAQMMLGSAKHVRLLDRVYDIATGRLVAGRYANRLAMVALNADRPELVLDHECFHFAYDNLLAPHERDIIHREFAPGTELNQRTRDTLIELGEVDAAAQCDNIEDAAAHAFSLWAHRQMSLEETPARGIFEDLRVLVTDAIAWIKRSVLQQDCVTSKDVFNKLLGGGFADHERQGSRVRAVDVQRAG